MKDPSTQEMNASCQVKPTAMRDAAAFHPAVPKAVENQYKGKLYHVQVRSSGGVGARSLFDHLESCIDESSVNASGDRRKVRKASLDWNDSLSLSIVASQF